MPKMMWALSYGFCSKFHTFYRSAVQIWQNYRNFSSIFIETVYMFLPYIRHSCSSAVDWAPDSSSVLNEVNEPWFTFLLFSGIMLVLFLSAAFIGWKRLVSIVCVLEGIRYFAAPANLPWRRSTAAKMVGWGSELHQSAIWCSAVSLTSLLYALDAFSGAIENRSSPFCLVNTTTLPTRQHYNDEWL